MVCFTCFGIGCSDDDGSPPPGGGGDGGGGGGGGGSDCTEFENATSTTSAVIRVVNQLSTPIYIPENECSDAYTISVNGKETDAILSFVDRTCKSLQTSTDPGPLDCIDGTVKIVEPAGTFERTWDGLLFETVTMPASCRPAAVAADGDVQCDRGIAAPAQGLTAVAHFFGTAVCNDGLCDQASDPDTVTTPFALPASGSEPAVVELTVTD